MFCIGCKKNHIKIKVVDVVTKEGIPGIQFFYGEEAYSSDANGDITIKSTLKVKDG